MLTPHIGPVIASAPPFGTISSVLLSFAALAIAVATPECTVPTSTSTLSRLISLFTLSVAFDGSDSSSTFTYSISRPPSLPPCSSTYRRKPFSIASPSAAYVPVYGSMKPTLIFGAWAGAGVVRTASAVAPVSMAAQSAKVRRCMKSPVSECRVSGVRVRSRHRRRSRIGHVVGSRRSVRSLRSRPWGDRDAASDHSRRASAGASRVPRRRCRRCAPSSRTGRRAPGSRGTGQAMSRSRSWMSNDRKPGDNHTSFQPWKAESTSA